MNITRGVKKIAQKIVIYGPEGVGKSTLAEQFPNPVFIDTEGSTTTMDVQRFDAPSSYTMLLEEIKYTRDNKPCSTLVIDTADWAEKLISEYVCSNKSVKGIEDIGYGKGYVYLAEEFGRMLNLLTEVIEAGINVVFTAHAQMRKFEQPDEMGAYDRWELKLQKKTAPLLMEWADMVLFCNYKTIVVNVDGQGAQKGKNKAQGNRRVMYTEHHPCWDAKNRHGLKAELDMKYSEIAHCIPDLISGQATPTTQTVAQPTVQSTVEATPQPTQPTPSEEPKRVEPVAEPKPEVKEEPKEETYQGIPKALADLMKEKLVTAEEIQQVVAMKGYYPKETPISNYDPNFINGVLVGAWDQVYGMIREQKILKGEYISTEGEEIPFN